MVMDNLPAHKVQGVTEARASVGAKVVYLSPYSPDFNPIEHLWLSLKSYLRSRISSALCPLPSDLKVTEPEQKNYFHSWR